MTRFARGLRDNHAIASSDKGWPYGWNGYLYVIGWFYYLCGYSPVTVKFLNCLLGALMGPLVYGIARRCFNLSTARWAAVWVAFFPSLILWATTNLKDIPFITLSLALCWLVYKIQEAKRIGHRGGWLLCFIGVWLMHATLKSAAYSVLLLVSLAVATLWALHPSRIWKTILGVAALAGLWFGQQPIRIFLTQAFLRHIGHIFTQGVSYQYLPSETFEESGFLTQWEKSGTFEGWVFVSIGRALVHYLGEPFLLGENHLLGLLAFPQMLVWYASLPFVIGGIVISLRRVARQTLFLIIMVMTWIFIGALTSGNIGTVFRTRDMVSSYLLLFACVGLRAFLYGSRAVLQPASRPIHVA